MRTHLIGCGNLGAYYAENFVSAKLVERTELVVVEKRAEVRGRLLQQGFDHVHGEPGDYLREAEMIILAVKPQDFGDLVSRAARYLHPDQVVLSIMAGVRIETIATALGTPKVVRAMPNLPAKIGLGMTAFTASDAVTREELFFIQDLLNSTGRTLYLSQEDKLDAVTAISGSGPGYVYYIMGAMLQAAQDLGFTQAQAEKLVTQTFYGAVQLHMKEPTPFDVWVDRVASKGGTTAAALATFEAGGLRQLIADGMKAAHQRARELSIPRESFDE